MSVKERKRRALAYFVNRLSESRVGAYVAKIILFGSVLRKRPNPASDIDVFVVAVHRPDEVSEVCDEVSLETSLECGELIAPIVGCIDEYRQDSSYFFREVIGRGREIYSMPKEQMNRAEARNFLDLATEYLEAAEPNLNSGAYRLVADAGYNAAELCAKGFLILATGAIPKRHGSVIQKFSELMVKSGNVPIEVGRKLHKSLRLRNQARYEFHRKITREEAQDILELARTMVELLEKELTGQRQE